MVNAEQVVIDIIANDKATSILENVRGKLIEINDLSNKYSEKISSINQNISNLNSKISDNVGNTPSKGSSQSKLEDFAQKGNVNSPKIDTNSVDSAKAKVNDFGNASQDATNKAKSGFEGLSKTVDEINGKIENNSKTLGTYSNYNYRSFDKVNTLLSSMSSEFDKIGTQIASIFGVAGFSGMIEKMWQGAAERQTNMLFLIRQRGVAQANEYYDEITNIVTQLPGDDTFLTNILNMASAMDKNIKLDNLKEVGKTITDFTIASTMKGERPFESQRDTRLYLNSGDTRSLRNSIISDELDLLENKNTILERTQALQEALDRKGLTGMSEYESASNELEEFKGHFQKAFADLGTIVTGITQPIMKFYNALDTLFGSRISQGIILIATALIGLFSVLAGGSIMIMWITRSIQIFGELREIIRLTSIEVSGLGGLKQYLTSVIADLLGVENAEKVIREGNVFAILSEYYSTLKLNIAKRLNIVVTEGETVSLWGLTTASLSYVKTQILKIANTIKDIILGQDEAVITGSKILLEQGLVNVTLTEVQVEEAKRVVLANNIRTKIIDTYETIKSTVVKGYDIAKDELSIIVKYLHASAEDRDTLAKESNTISTIKNTVSKFRDALQDAKDIGVKIARAIIIWITTDATLSNALASQSNTIAKLLETDATLGLAIATTILNVELLPLIIIVGAIALAIAGLVIGIEKLGEAFGWWSDFGSMFGAIADGVGRLWNAFMGSEVIQGIIQYFSDFVSVIQYVWESISGLFGAIFGWDESNTGTFDIVQSIIDIFGTLGEVVKWVWNILDDWSNSPLGIITWLNPLDILIFHLDEIGSLFEDIGDAINRFTQTTEFQTLMKEFGEVWNELQAPFQEIWSLIQEIIGLFGELFGGSEDPEGTGTEERINFLVDILRGLATIIRVVVIPAIRGVALVIRIVLTPLRIVLTVVREIIKAIQWASSVVDLFGIAWQIITTPLTIVQNILQGIGNMINTVSDAIKNSIIGKLLGWDKDDNGDKSGDSQVEGTRKSLYDRMKNRVSSSDMDIVTKHQILGELDKQNLTTNNVNNVRNLGRTYNNHNNQRQTVIHQHFSEGSMPIDARNMTKKEARKTFISAFGFNRAVGHNGVLR